jgi:hypothetical protein
MGAFRRQITPVGDVSRSQLPWTDASRMKSIANSEGHGSGGCLSALPISYPISGGCMGTSLR